MAAAVARQSRCVIPGSEADTVLTPTPFVLSLSKHIYEARDSRAIELPFDKLRANGGGEGADGAGEVAIVGTDNA